MKLTSITGWRHSKEEQTQDFATSGFYYARREQNYTQWSQELRASGNLGDQLDFVVGEPNWGSGFGGVYVNTIKFNVAACPAGQQAKLTIRYLADNNGSLLLDSVQIAQQNNSILDGWRMQNMASAVVPVAAGAHSLTLKLNNWGGKSAFLVIAVLLR